jgi:hypothetical protein
MIKWTLNILITVILVIIFLDILLYCNGSLELYPTEEQSEKLHVVTISAGLLLTAIELLLIFIRIKTTKDSKT